MFVDEVTLKIEAGTGGNGCNGFRREKGVPFGGPAGGNGGRGANIIFEVDEGLRTLLDLRYNKLIKGKRGDHGLGKSKHGRSAKDTILKVPPGTVVKDADTGYIVADLTNHGEQVIVAHGGRGGRGNKAFATNANPAPNFAENGEPGEIKNLSVELKLLADVGLVGLPSVGKSTLLSIISASKPKIAAYHFTTLTPNLGVVKTKDNRSYVVADLPGLIKGASLGDGLGDQFLRHIERTKIIAHIIDMGASEGRDPIEDYKIINKELKDFNPAILDKLQTVIANKMDLPEAEANLKKFKKAYPDVEVLPISAIKKEGIDPVIIRLADLLDEIPKTDLYEEEQFESYMLYKFEEKQPFIIEQEDDTWIITGDEIEKLFKMTQFSTIEGQLRFAKKLSQYGINAKLDELGAKLGDTVKILDFEFEYRS